MATWGQVTKRTQTAPNSWGNAASNAQAGNDRRPQQTAFGVRSSGGGWNAPQAPGGGQQPWPGFGGGGQGGGGGGGGQQQGRSNIPPGMRMTDRTIGGDPFASQMYATYVEPNFARATQHLWNNNPFAPYSGQTVAGLDPMQRSAINGIDRLANPNDPSYRQAMRSIEGVQAGGGLGPGGHEYMSALRGIATGRNDIPGARDYRSMQGNPLTGQQERAGDFYRAALAGREDLDTRGLQDLDPFGRDFGSARSALEGIDTGFFDALAGGAGDQSAGFYNHRRQTPLGEAQLAVGEIMRQGHSGRLDISDRGYRGVDPFSGQLQGAAQTFENARSGRMVVPDANFRALLGGAETPQARAAAEVFGDVAGGDTGVDTSVFDRRAQNSLDGRQEQAGRNFGDLYRRSLGPSAAERNLAGMASGDNLGRQNEAAADLLQEQLDSIQARVASDASLSGRSGSPFQAETLTRSLGSVANQFMADQYERDRQAQLAASGLIEGAEGRRFAEGLSASSGLAGIGAARVAQEQDAASRSAQFGLAGTDRELAGAELLFDVGQAGFNNRTAAADRLAALAGQNYDRRMQGAAAAQGLAGQRFGQEMRQQDALVALAGSNRDFRMGAARDQFSIGQAAISNQMQAQAAANRVANDNINRRLAGAQAGVNTGLQTAAGLQSLGRDAFGQAMTREQALLQAQGANRDFSMAGADRFSALGQQGRQNRMDALAGRIGVESANIANEAAAASNALTAGQRGDALSLEAAGMVPDMRRGQFAELDRRFEAGAERQLQEQVRLDDRRQRQEQRQRAPLAEFDYLNALYGGNQGLAGALYGAQGLNQQLAAQQPNEALQWVGAGLGGLSLLNQLGGGAAGGGIGAGLGSIGGGFMDALGGIGNFLGF